MTSVEVVPTTADDAHAALVAKVALIEEDGHSLACAVHDAYVCEAWMRDQGEHEHRYRLLMMEKGFTSIFHAYAYDEFRLKAGVVDRLKRNGQLIEVVPHQMMGIVHRASNGALAPLSAAGVLNTTEPAQLVEVLDVAAKIADESITQLQLKSGRPAPITSTIVKEAMKKVGVGEYVAPKSEEEEAAEAIERRAAKIDAAKRRLDKDVRTLAELNQRAALRDVAQLIIRLLDDQPKMLDDIRKALS